MRKLALIAILFLLIPVRGYAVSVSPLPSGRTQFSNSSGLLVGGFVYTCVGGATCPGTPLATFTDYTGAHQNTNPIVLDAYGSASIWLTPSVAYKLVIEDSAGVVQWTEDGITANIPSGGGIVDVQNLNGIRFPDQFTGADAGAKQDAAIADLAGLPGVLFDTTNLSCGVPASIPNNVLIMDWRQCTDIIPGSPTGSTTDPMRPQVLLFKQALGEFDETALDGTVTLTDGNTTITGVGTHFTTQLNITTYITPVIKLSSTATATCWEPVSSVTDDTHATAVSNTPAGCGGSGAAVRMKGQLGLGVQTNITGGYPNTQQMGEYSVLQGVVHRSAGTRGIYGANFNLRYDTAATSTSGQAYGVECDISNASGTDDATSNNSFCFSGISAGTNIAGTGMFVGATNAPTNGWIRGGFISGFSDVGLLIQNTWTGSTVQAIHILPNATDVLTFNPAVCVADVADTICPAALNYDGSASLQGDLRMNTVAASTNAISLTGKALANTPVFSTGVDGDSVPRYEILADGTQELGPGSGALDTVFSRSGIGVLSVTGSFNASAGFRMGGTAPSNHILLGDGTNYVDSATLPSTSLNVTSSTPIANLNAYPYTLDHGGTQIVGPHIVQDTCTLGTDCSVTLVGAAIFANTSYVCMARDVTTAANVVTIAKTSVSQIDFTGTGTDVIEYFCNGR